MVFIRGGQVLCDGAFRKVDLCCIREGKASRLDIDGTKPASARRLDADGCLVLPGIVDIHGDAFERQIMPRPGVAFDLDLALSETDRQLVSNGITTAFHGLTWSWERGFRGAESARAFLSAVECMKPELSADTFVHLRHEVFNFVAEVEISDWISAGRIGLLAFNDHLTGTIKVRHRPDKIAAMVSRTGMTHEAFLALTDSLAAREDDMRAATERLAKAAIDNRTPMMSHDDLTVDMRAHYRTLGAGIAEFPVTEEVARASAQHKDHIVFGAPNVLRGGSHTNCPSAADMASQKLCTILASDYYYPALPQAPFVLAAKHGVPLEEGWKLVSENPARAAGLEDRGRIETGARADLIVIKASPNRRAQVVATIVNGSIVHLTEAGRLN
jgi:alpha-D-ribose 1-methylphosphonate 5-triphosphate diphosphatase